MKLQTEWGTGWMELAPVGEIRTATVAALGLGVLGTAHAALRYAPDAVPEGVDLSWSSKFFEPSHYNAEADGFARGPDDFYLGATMVMLWIVLRFIVKHAIARPVASRYIRSRFTKWKFVEMWWTGWYSLYSFSMGVYLIQDWPLWRGVWHWAWYDTAYFWHGYPFVYNALAFKLFYLAATAFWIASFVTMLTEPRRKDFYEMLFHHPVTIMLLATSYYHNHTRIGVAVLLCTEGCDFWLQAAKMCNYAKKAVPTHVFFVGFVVTWAWTRHYVYNTIVWSLYDEADSIMEYRPVDTAAGYFYTPGIRAYYFGLFFGLQLVLLYWFALILKMVWGLVVNGPLQGDVRSSDEEDEGEPKPKTE